ncbi:MAG TPA: hypothetical protein VG734_27050 [Lacunisphaera sp.]|nr:hypothetical protein [Lacunisphaera sp.]
MNLMTIISLLAGSLAVMVFLYALRHAQEGHEDALGFHFDGKPEVSQSKARTTRKRRSPAARAFGHNPVAGLR